MSEGRTAQAGSNDKSVPARLEGGVAPARSKGGDETTAVTVDPEEKQGFWELIQWFRAGIGKIGARAFWFAQCFTAKIW